MPERWPTGSSCSCCRPRCCSSPVWVSTRTRPTRARAPLRMTLACTGSSPPRSPRPLRAGRLDRLRPHAPGGPLRAGKLYRAVAIAHAIAWHGSGRGARTTPRGIALLGLALVASAVAAELTGVARRSNDVGGVAALAVYFAVVGCAWLLVSVQLPHRDVRWVGLLPGACLVGVGLLAVNVFNVYVTTRLVENQANTYGALGIAAALLFSLVLVGQGGRSSPPSSTRRSATAAPRVADDAVRALPARLAPAGGGSRARRCAELSHRRHGGHPVAEPGRPEHGRRSPGTPVHVRGRTRGHAPCARAVRPEGRRDGGSHRRPRGRRRRRRQPRGRRD